MLKQNTVKRLQCFWNVVKDQLTVVVVIVMKIEVVMILSLSAQKFRALSITDLMTF